MHERFVGQDTVVTDLDEPADVAWYDESELRWDATAKVIRVLVAFMVLAAVAGIWLVASRLVLDDVCQSTQANADRVVLEACQSRTSWAEGPLEQVAAPLLAATIAIGASAFALGVSSLFLAIGTVPRLAVWSTRLDTVAMVVMWLLVAVAGLAALWATFGTVGALRSAIELARSL